MGFADCEQWPVTPAGSVRHCRGRNGQSASLHRYHVMATSVPVVKQPPDLQEFSSLGNARNEVWCVNDINDSTKPLVLSRCEPTESRRLLDT